MALDISMTYIIIAFLTVLLNNVFLSLASLHVRVTFGYIVSFATLIFVALCEVAYHVFDTSNEYSVNLVAVGLVAIGCTGKQYYKCEKKSFSYYSIFPSTTIQLLRICKYVTETIHTSCHVRREFGWILSFVKQGLNQTDD